ncbi:MAG: DUF4160 domain-containing protein [Mesorhizobium sp.]
MIEKETSDLTEGHKPAEAAEAKVHYLDGSPVFDLLARIRPNDGHSIEFIVDIYHGLRVMMFFDEHPPPHFAVKYDGEIASFSIQTCARLRGNRGLERYEPKIREWWKDHQSLLIESWNSSRPSDCPVGLIRTPVTKPSPPLGKKKSKQGKARSKRR